MNGIQEVSGSIPLSSTMETWDKFMAESLGQDIPWIVLGILAILYVAFYFVQKKTEKKRLISKQYKQKVYDRWHDQDR